MVLILPRASLLSQQPLLSLLLLLLSLPLLFRSFSELHWRCYKKMFLQMYLYTLYNYLAALLLPFTQAAAFLLFLARKIATAVVTATAAVTVLWAIAIAVVALVVFIVKQRAIAEWEKTIDWRKHPLCLWRVSLESWIFSLNLHRQQHHRPRHWHYRLRFHLQHRRHQHHLQHHLYLCLQHPYLFRLRLCCRPYLHIYLYHLPRIATHLHI